MGEEGDAADAFTTSSSAARSGCGTITRIRLENFMCHSSLLIDLCSTVNFITGQNGSGKSAILTALCIAFGCRAKGTQRALSLKEFIKTGCSHALIEVVIKNRGEDAFKPATYGDSINIERRITDSSSSLVLKDHRGKRVSTKRIELRELLEHFNIDVENPCVVMSQDKSREFLHSGSEKDKFKFFFKATLLQRVKDLLQSIEEQLESMHEHVIEMESAVKPIEKELTELQEKIKNLEHAEDLAVQIQQLKKKLAWAWVYDVDKQLNAQLGMINSLKERIPICQAKIDNESCNITSLRDQLRESKTLISQLVEKTQEVQRKKNELQQTITLALKEKLEIEANHRMQAAELDAMEKRVGTLKQQVLDMQEQILRNSQAETSKMEEKLNQLEQSVIGASERLLRLEEEERMILEKQSTEQSELSKIVEEMDEITRREREIRSAIRDCCLHKTNKVTAFGGNRVIQLLQAVEKHQRKFSMPPIGPIGAHVTLANGDLWAPAVENAIGRLLDAFIVTNHSDSVLLRRCAKEAGYDHLQIIIYDFGRPRLVIPSHLVPQTDHPSTLSVLRSDNTTVLNVLVDLGNAERQVLVENYDSGKAVAFDRRIPNLKEVFTLDGYRMFFRGSVQTVLPPNKRLKTGRLCGSYEIRIENLEQELGNVVQEVEQCRKRKRCSESSLQTLSGLLRKLTEKRLNAERELSRMKLDLDEKKKSYVVDANSTTATDVEEIHQEISNISDKMRAKEELIDSKKEELHKVQEKIKPLKASFENLCELAKEDIAAFEEAEHKLVKIENDLKDAEKNKAHYEDVMNNKVLSDIRVAETQYEDLENTRKESCRKASIICSESEIEALGDWDGSTPDKLSALLSRLQQRLQLENNRCSDSLDDLRLLYNEKESKVIKKRQAYLAFREKIKACMHALKLRQSKFERNTTLLKRELTWGFNSHLGRKGISGNIKVDYEEQTLKVEVKMPQDASSGNVRDTKGLSGGERSFSTLCFALALHQMIESPFRAMDEFDVFMDAVSRKISLDTLVNYALVQGSQWIFITPHDISMVKQDARIKKQIMAAPRS